MQGIHRAHRSASSFNSASTWVVGGGGLCLGQAFVRPGSDVGQVWVKPGSDLGQDLVRPGSHMGEAWVRLGSELGQSLVSPGRRGQYRSQLFLLRGTERKREIENYKRGRSEGDREVKGKEERDEWVYRAEREERSRETGRTEGDTGQETDALPPAEYLARAQAVLRIRFHSTPPPTSTPFPVSRPARPDCLNRNVTVEITATRGANARSLARAARLI